MEKDGDYLILIAEASSLCIIFSFSVEKVQYASMPY